MIPDFLVYVILALTAMALAAWGLSPALRLRLEAPKRMFIEDIRRYDRDQP